ncbi:hypothetical protein ACA910_006733 [Epithemia clementina (nom. ined.)]
MILSRWSSAAFLRYIRPQVMEWTAGMSMSMLRSPDFRHAELSMANQPITTSSANNLSPDPEALQANLDAAMENPKEIQFSGSMAESAGDHHLNLGF